MNKKISKDLNFLKSKLISRKGIFDNKRIYENTFSAFERAIKNDYIIELQVRMLKDAVLVVFDDDDMERLLHVEGNIDKITYDELSFMAKYQIPRLDDVLDLIKGNVPIIIDIKTKSKGNSLEVKLSKLLDKYNGLYAIESKNVKSLKWFDKNKSDIAIGYVMDKKTNKNEPFIFRKYDFINMDIELFNDKRVRKMREDRMILGHVIEDIDTLDKKRSVYDNLSCYNILEIDKK